jgi:hypothetical protein
MMKSRRRLLLLRLHSSSSANSDDTSNIDNDTDDDDDTMTFDMSDISDGEALLACRSFLQRKNRFGWKRAAERKELRKASRGFFWETPEQQQYWSKREEEDIDFNQGSDNDDDGCPSGPGELSSLLAVEERTLAPPTGLFTSMPTGPNERSEVRRRVKVQQWNDPAFRERWYEARWGHDYIPQTNVAKKQQRLQLKLQTIPDAILESPEFALLTPAEIDEAIRTYVVSNRKRSRSRTKQGAERQQQRRRQRQVVSPSVQVQEEQDASTTTKPPNKNGSINDDDITPSPPLDRDALFSMSNEALREKQRQRSERAKKAYDTRLSNAAAAAKQQQRKPSLASRKSAATTLSKQQQASSSSSSGWKPMGNTPKDALIRVGADLDADRMPLLADVESIMEATKLSRRKDILLRILKEHFQMRGKCIPILNAEKECDDDDDANTETTLIYMTQASITQLGAFLIGLMQEK